MDSQFDSRLDPFGPVLEQGNHQQRNSGFVARIRKLARSLSGSCSRERSKCCGKKRLYLQTIRKGDLIMKNLIPASQLISTPEQNPLLITTSGFLQNQRRLVRSFGEEKPQNADSIERRDQSDDRMQVDPPVQKRQRLDGKPSYSSNLDIRMNPEDEVYDEIREIDQIIRSKMEEIEKLKLIKQQKLMETKSTEVHINNGDDKYNQSSLNSFKSESFESDQQSNKGDSKHMIINDFTFSRNSNSNRNKEPNLISQRVPNHQVPSNLDRNSQSSSRQNEFIIPYVRKRNPSNSSQTKHTQDGYFDESFPFRNNIRMELDQGREANEVINSLQRQKSNGSMTKDQNTFDKPTSLFHKHLV